MQHARPRPARPTCPWPRASAPRPSAVVGERDLLRSTRHCHRIGLCFDSARVRTGHMGGAPWLGRARRLVDPPRHPAASDRACQSRAEWRSRAVPPDVEGGDRCARRWQPHRAAAALQPLPNPLQRPASHEALAQRATASIWQPSRPFPERLFEPEYPVHYLTRLVSSQGAFGFRNGQTCLTSALASQWIGLDAPPGPPISTISDEKAKTNKGVTHDPSLRVTDVPGRTQGCNSRTPEHG
jgi:hypothetical protein